MSDHEPKTDDRVFIVSQQVIRVEDPFADGDLILDLGGGGEGVIGLLRGRQVVAVDRRANELEESALGPIKLIGDARELPFLDGAFDAVTSFCFLMYVPAEDRPAVLAEAHRVLKPGGNFHVWGVRIPPKEQQPQKVYCVMIKAVLPDREIETGYGVPWAGREMTAASIGALAREAGFELVDKEEAAETFRLTLRRPEVG